MPQHLELAHKMIKDSVEARLEDSEHVHTTAQRKTAANLSGMLDEALLPASRPSVDFLPCDVDIRIPKTIDPSPTAKRNHLLTFFMTHATDVYMKQDWENSFWRQHFNSNIRVEVDGKFSKGFDSFRENGDLILQQQPKVRMEVAEICISEMSPRKTCTVIMIVKLCNSVDGLTRGGVISSTWKRSLRGWKCSEWLYASGLDGELSGV